MDTDLGSADGTAFFAALGTLSFAAFCGIIQKTGRGKNDGEIQAGCTLCGNR